MAYTMQQVVDRARVPLNDDDKARYTDADLLAEANASINLLKLKRPDLFFGQFLALPGDKELTDSFPLDDTMFAPVAAYVTGMAETKNDDSVLEQRAELFLNIFKSWL